MEAARKAIALVPIESDADFGASYLLTLAQVYAHFGDADQAVPLIAKLLDSPGTGEWYFARSAASRPDLGPDPQGRALPKTRRRARAERMMWAFAAVNA